MTPRVIKSAFSFALLFLTLNHSAYSTINPLDGVKAAQLDQAALNKSSKLTSTRLDGLNLPFIANAGQTDPKVGFYAQTFAGTVYVTRAGELVYSLPPAKTGKRGWTLVERFEQGKAHPTGKDSSPSQVSYIKDHKGKAVTQSAKTFGGLALGEVFPGVQVELRAHGKTVEKIYTLSPGAEPSRIRMGVSGANSLKLDKDGNLLASTGNGEVQFSAPIAWQELDGKRTPVNVRYALEGKHYGYALGEYDHQKPVMIDPLLSATYLGGNGEDTVSDVAIHPVSGDVYVYGNTLNPPRGFTNSFPGTAGGYQSAQKYGQLPYLARLSNDLKQLKQATYIDMNNDSGLVRAGLIIHPANGDIYLWGGNGFLYDSDSHDVPGTSGAALKSGLKFICRFSQDLTKLIQSTYISKQVIARAVAIHPLNGDFYFTGGNKDSGNISDILVQRVAQDLKAYSKENTIPSSSELDFINDIAIHPTSGDVYVTGTTQFNDFPNTAGGFQPQNNSVPAKGIREDAFVVRLSEDLSIVKQATYLGGTNNDEGKIITFDARGESLYVSGIRGSGSPAGESETFPGLTGDVTFNTTGNFLSRMSLDLKTLIQSTLIPPPIKLQPTAGGIYLIPEVFPYIYRFSEDLTKYYGKQLLLIDYTNPSRDILAEVFSFSPLSGELYIAGIEIGKSNPLPPAIAGYQSTSNIKSGGNGDILVARYTISDIGSSEDQEGLFNWAEKKYPGLFAPAGVVTQLYDPYFFRYYKTTNAYLGVSQDDQHVYYLGPDGAKLDAGELSEWLITKSSTDIDNNSGLNGALSCKSADGLSVEPTAELDKIECRDANNKRIFIINPNFAGETFLPGCAGKVNDNPNTCRLNGSITDEAYAVRLNFSRGLDPAIYQDVAYRILYDTIDAMINFDSKYRSFKMTISTQAGDFSGTVGNCRRLDGSSSGSIDVLDARQNASQNSFACVLKQNTLYYINIKPTNANCKESAKDATSVDCRVFVRNQLPD